MFNFEKNGDKIAVVNSAKRQRKVYFSEDDGKESIDLKDKDGEFMLSPDKLKERETMYVCGWFYHESNFSIIFHSKSVLLCFSFQFFLQENFFPVYFKFGSFLILLLSINQNFKLYVEFQFKLN